MIRPALHEFVRAQFARLGFRRWEWRNPSRERALSYARAEVAYIIRTDPQCGNPSYPEIAHYVGVRDHTSAIYMVRAHAYRNGLPDPTEKPKQQPTKETQDDVEEKIQWAQRTGSSSGC